MAKTRWEINHEFARPELAQIVERGYKFDDPWDVIDLFERKVAQFAGSKYAVAVDCCSHAIFLSAKLRMEQWYAAIHTLAKGRVVEVPKNTWFSVPMQIKYAGFIPYLVDMQWEGGYWLNDMQIWDGAVRWKKGMYTGKLHCLSFQIKKNLPIGKGGMVLTNKEDEYNWLKLARYDGRDMSTDHKSLEHINMFGYHMYMTPEDAARGIILMDELGGDLDDMANWEDYPDLKIALKDIEL